MRLSAIAWSAPLRILAFWGLVCGVVWGVAQWWSWLDFGLIADVIKGAFRGELERVSTLEFAFAIASALAAAGLGLAVAFLILHVAAIWVSLWSARLRITRAQTMADFAQAYDTIHQRISRKSLLQHAWKEFDETLVRPPTDREPIRNTVRPQSFININVAREKLFGLKMMGSIPSYFVGTGLLLTFIGLVLALHEAARAVSSSDAEGMQIATRQLLQVATFKFATSIAGLGVSIVLSFLFRAYIIAIEDAFEKFCHSVEKRLRYMPPQAITVQMNEHLAAQVSELKQINSSDFFARMGEAVSPQIQRAFATAMTPVTDKMNDVIGRIEQSSQSGVSELIERFTQGVQNGAGAELRELSLTLKTVHDSLLATQRGISGTGEDFGRRMSESAENLNRLISQAGERLDGSAEKSRNALLDAVQALQQTFERANTQVEKELGSSAAGASAKIEEAMGRVLDRLEAQISGLNSGVGNFQQTLARQLDQTREHVTAAQASATAAIGAIATEAATALREGLAEAMQAIRSEIQSFSQALSASEASLAAQANAVREASDQSRLVSDAFSRTAQDVRTASVPLVQSGERVAGATEKMSQVIERAVSALGVEQEASRSLAAALQSHIEHLGNLWSTYAAQFEKVDAELGSAVAKLAEATHQQGQTLADYAARVDEGFAKAIQNLTPTLESLQESAEGIEEAADGLRRVLVREAAE
ncbi:anti-phage ZorAB system protein ZorA [Faunimonas sp. B44]|uniref:anti-phage ZorAB system protein ZorA n=1 Tax=Faunimonas sp. B44 TaxID=3461493 RepID=UPI004043A60D